jgi:hypothetical protein
MRLALVFAVAMIAVCVLVFGTLHMFVVAIASLRFWIALVARFAVAVTPLLSFLLLFAVTPWLPIAPRILARPVAVARAVAIAVSVAGFVEHSDRLAQALAAFFGFAGDLIG